LRHSVYSEVQGEEKFTITHSGCEKNEKSVPFITSGSTKAVQSYHIVWDRMIYTRLKQNYPADSIIVLAYALITESQKSEAFNELGNVVKLHKKQTA